MKHFLQRLGASLSAAWGRSGGIRLRSIRRERTAYFLAYAVELVLYAVRQRFLPVEETLFGFPGKTVVYVVHMLVSLVVILLWSERFKNLLRVSVGVMAGGFLLFVFAPQGTMLHLLAGCAAMGGLGGAVTCARCGFAFAANNAERAAGMLLMTVAVAVVYVLKPLGAAGPLFTHVLPLALTALLAILLLGFREDDLEAKETTGKEDAKGLYCALAFMIVYFGVDGYLYKLVDKASLAGSLLFSGGMVVGAAVFALMLLALRQNVWHLWSLFFAFATLAAVLAVLAPRTGTELPHQFVSGLAILGWPLSLYMLACAQRRFASYRLLKQCTLIFIILSPLTTVTDDVIFSFAPESIPAVTLVYVLAMLLLFLLTVPYTYKHLFSVGWIGELSREDMEKPREGPVDRFRDYDLTPRQREVAELLLEAKTRRQIAGELGLSESTVKMHTAELYRRLGINSRVELFRLFGPTEEGK